jgi:hypothetical protein
MTAATTTSGLTPPSAPAKDRPGKPAPERIAEVLAVVSILATYARHLVETLEQRAVARGFATIAQFFGTVAFDTILAHIYRGLMRAIALERLLLRRAACGRDLRILAPRAPSRGAPPQTNAADPGETAEPMQTEALTPSEEPTPAQDAAAPEPDAAEPDAPEPDAAAVAAARLAEARITRRLAASTPLTLYNLPSMAAIEAEVRRSPVGRTIAEICRDLGISPALCSGAFWNRLFDAIRLYRGNCSKLVLDLKQREKRFDKEDWKHPGLQLPEETRDGIRRVLGFFIGETPVDPFAVVTGPGASVTAAATGPP